MLNFRQAPIRLHSMRLRSLPEAGQRVRVVVCNSIELWQGNRRVQFREGDVYEGTVARMFDNGMLDLRTRAGQQLQFYALDGIFEIETVDGD